MNLTDIVVPEAIVPNLQPNERDDVLKELVDRLGKQRIIWRHVRDGPAHGRDPAVRQPCLPRPQDVLGPFVF